MKSKTQAQILRRVYSIWTSIFKRQRATLVREDGTHEILTKIKATSALEDFMPFAARMIAEALEGAGLNVIQFKDMPPQPKWLEKVDRFLHNINQGLNESSRRKATPSRKGNQELRFCKWLSAQAEPKPEQLKEVFSILDVVIPDVRKALINLMPASPGGRPRKFIDAAVRRKIVRDIKRLRGPSVRLVDIFGRLKGKYNLPVNRIKQIWLESKPNRD